MPQFLLLLLIILLVMVIVGTGVSIYLSARGIAKLVRAFRVSSSLPRSITRSLKESRQYGRLILQAVQQYPPGPLRDRLNPTIRPVNEWLASLTRLEQGLDKLHGQHNLSRELRQTAFDIDLLRRRLTTADEKEASYLRELLESKKHHRAALNELQAFQTQAELKIRKISSDLGTTYAEVLLIIAKGDFNENRLHRLDENLQEHLSSMRDIMAAMDEMGYRSATT